MAEKPERDNELQGIEEAMRALVPVQATGFLDLRGEQGDTLARVEMPLDMLERVRSTSITGHDAAPTPVPARRRGIKPPTKNLVFPNEPGHRALAHAVTSKHDDWQAGEGQAHFQTPLLGPKKQPLMVTLDASGVMDPLGFAKALLPGDDGTALKVLLALPALFFEHNPGAPYNAEVETTVPEFMRYMGFKSKKGGFDSNDQIRVWRAIGLISRLWIPGVTERNYNGTKHVTGEGTWHSPVILLHRVQEGSRGFRLPKAFSFSLGREIHAYYTGEPGRSTRMLQITPRIMELHGKNDLPILKLFPYYAGLFRIRQRGAGQGRQSMTIGYTHVLEQAGVTLDTTNLRRQLQRVIGWHKELVSKGMIADFNLDTPVPGAGLSDYQRLKVTVSRESAHPPLTVA